MTRRCDARVACALGMTLISAFSSGCMTSHHQDQKVDPYEQVTFSGYASKPDADISIQVQDDGGFVEIAQARSGSTPAIGEDGLGDNPPLYSWASSARIASTSDEALARWKRASGAQAPTARLQFVEAGGVLPEMAVFPEGGVNCVLSKTGAGESLQAAGADCMDGQELRLTASESPYRYTVQIRAPRVVARDTTEGGYLNDRDEVYFTAAGATLSERELTFPRISPSGSEDYFQFWDGTSRSLDLMEFELEPGDGAFIAVWMREQDFGKLSQVIGSTLAAVGVVVGILGSAGALSTVSGAALLHQLHSFHEDDGDQDLGYFGIQVENVGGRIEVKYHDYEGSELLQQGGGEGSFRLTSAEDWEGNPWEYELDLSTTLIDTVMEQRPLCPRGQYCCEPFADTCFTCVPEGAHCP